MKISTSNYENTWGSKPRGEGFWAFQFYHKQHDVLVLAPGPSAYRDAKAWAIAHARTIGADRVAVAT